MRLIRIHQFHRAPHEVRFVQRFGSLQFDVHFLFGNNDYHVCLNHDDDIDWVDVDVPNRFDQQIVERFGEGCIEDAILGEDETFSFVIEGPSNKLHFYAKYVSEGVVTLVAAIFFVF